MTPTQFIKEFGLHAAQYIAINAGYKHYCFNIDISAWQMYPNKNNDFVVIHELKNTLENIEIIKSLGGITQAEFDVQVSQKTNLNWWRGFTIERLKQAITEFKAIQGN